MVQLKVGQLPCTRIIRSGSPGDTPTMSAESGADVIAASHKTALMAEPVKHLVPVSDLLNFLAPLACEWDLRTFESIAKNELGCAEHRTVPRNAQHGCR